MSDSLYLAERRRVIIEQLKKNGRVSVNDLSGLLNVSAVTIRQDLRSLEAEGVLERTHGGAVLPQAKPSGPELSFEVRLRRRTGEKDVIARASAELVQDGMSVALDASTTAYAMVPYLKQRKLLVVTNSLIVAQGFLDSPQITVLMPAGRLRRDSIALIGQPDTLPEINLNIGFFGARGISPITGITDADLDEVNIKRAMMKRCLRNVIVADRDKWDIVAPYQLAELHQVHTIVTTLDRRAPILTPFRKQGVDIISVAVNDRAV